MKSFEYIGLEVISACLKKAGYETKMIFDPMLFSDVYMNIPILSRHFDATQAIIRQAQEYKPDFILFSMSSDDVIWVKEKARQLKQATGAIIVAGGVHPTAVPERVVKYKYFDYVVSGEGEETVPELLSALVQGKPVDGIKGVYHLLNGQIKGEENRSLLQDLDVFPPPDKDLFYSTAPWAKHEYSIVISRGCPHRCTYCHNNYLRGKWDGQGKYIRTRSVSHVIGELAQSKRIYNFSTLNIWDDNLFALKDYSNDFFTEYAEKIKVPFKMFLHPSLVNNDTAKILANANCWRVEVGVQTIDPNGRKICGRTETDEMITNAIRILKNHGIKVSVSIITGLPYESQSQLYTMAHFFAETKPDRILAFLLRYYPKTDILEIGMKAGIISERDRELIEEGEYVASFTSRRDIQDKTFKRVRGLLMISNHLSPGFIDWMESLGAEKWLPDLSSTIQTLDQVKGFLQPHNDLARLYRKRYFYYLLGQGRNVLK